MDSPSPRRYHHHNLNSPNSSTSSTNSNGGGGLNQQNHLPPPLPTAPTSSSVAAQAPPPPPPPPLYAPRNNLGRSESGSPYPTTFVQADTNSFKQVVQMLTGCNETARLAAASSNIAARGEAHSSSSSKNHHSIPPMKTIPNKKNQHPHQQHQPGFKLYERRNNNLNLNPLLPTLSSSKSSGNINNVNVVVGSPRFSSPRNHHHHHHHHEVLSPSILDLPALVLSPVTPLIPDPFGRSSAATPTTPAAAAGYNGNIGGSPILDRDAEERAIKEKGFYLHPSPGNTTPRDAEPRLLPLFPTASPRASASSSSA